MLQPVYLQASTGMCLSLENEVSCKDQLQTGVPVCAWRNVMLQPCMQPRDAASLDQVWVLDEASSAVMAAGSFQLGDNICLEACTDTNYGRGACSLIENNVGETPTAVPAIDRLLRFPK